jgi:hypothetical protein
MIKIILILLLIIIYYKVNNEKYLEISNKKINKNLKLIHIGKCGGSTIRKLVKNKVSQYHLNRNYKDNENYIIWLRNPIKRFVSAFYYQYDLINTNTRNLEIKKLTLKNSLGPNKIKRKISQGFTYTKRFDYLMNYFKTPNNLAESITSKNTKIKKLALELMNSQIEHIYKGIGWYLNNGDFIDKKYNNIKFVGTLENMEDDLKRLGKFLNIKITNKLILRENKNKHNKLLSPKAIKNILNFYKHTDYKALQKLVEYNYITKELFEEYHYYNL